MAMTMATTVRVYSHDFTERENFVAIGMVLKAMNKTIKEAHDHNEKLVALMKVAKSM